MTLTGELFIATQRQRGAAQAFQAIDPQRDCALEPNFLKPMHRKLMPPVKARQRR